MITPETEAITAVNDLIERVQQELEDEAKPKELLQLMKCDR